MFNKVSMTGTGIIITIITSILSYYKISASGGDIAQAANGIIAVFGLIFMVWGQIRRKDLVNGIKRR